MLIYDEKDIVGLFERYKQIYSYSDRLIFFDKYFKVVPFKFPMFQSDSDLLFKGIYGDLILKFFELERLNKAVKHETFTIKTFNCFGKKYLFKITPSNSLMGDYNEYIINKLINKDSNFNEKVNLLKSRSINNRDQFIGNFQNEMFKIKRLESIVNDIDQKVSIKNLFLKVYYNGYSDYKNGYIKSFPMKKKFVELYLYAQGVLLAKYFEEVEKYIQKNKYSNLILGAA